MLQDCLTLISLCIELQFLISITFVKKIEPVVIKVDINTCMLPSFCFLKEHMIVYFQKLHVILEKIKLIIINACIMYIASHPIHWPLLIGIKSSERCV